MRPATLVGIVVTVTGSHIRVQLHANQPSIALVNGEAHRVGQIGAYLRIPVGFSDLYGVCTQVGSGVAPRQNNDLTTGDIDEEAVDQANLDGRWLSMSLFGESVCNEFERGISVYPIVGDEVHLVTAAEVAMVHRSSPKAPMVSIGTIAGSGGLEAEVDVAKLVTRHSAVIGSTGAGKSNFVTTFLRAVAAGHLPSSRILVVDAHGEYGDSLKEVSRIFSITPRGSQEQLYVPYWALPFDELLAVTSGTDLREAHITDIRNEVEARKREAALHLATPPPQESVTADSPVPFSLKNVWMDLRQHEDQTYNDNARTSPLSALNNGDVARLIPRSYPPVAAGNVAPYAPSPRHIGRQLGLMKNRMLDDRYRFLFEPGVDYTPDLATQSTAKDLDELIASWVGHDKPITVLDVSSAPADVLPLVVGMLLRITYDALVWAGDLQVSGRSQPLLVVLEEAHRFIKEGGITVANRVISTIAKEGRKYGIGLMLVSQRPSDLDKEALSQCGTLIALRMTNHTDRGHVTSVMPDEMAVLGSLLPALRTGEALVSGEAVAAPTRVRVARAHGQHRGADADVADGWRQATRPDAADYERAVANWRATTFVTPAAAPTEISGAATLPVPAVPSTEQGESRGDA
ncbi:ATP-binding protein [Tsukamurella tyrosinosolvens]|uniref:ATP-binding protein n=1 Tax=Tsukamurella tyrosinosolvens TaxID=57704 RepID=UPI001CE181EF|nr:ATP-binding protein [Tsukamurella tyrosinosolvens]MCA4995235.1 ATP-binding protein [Tsukamurella tyrosinosolvens]